MSIIFSILSIVPVGKIMFFGDKWINIYLCNEEKKASLSLFNISGNKSLYSCSAIFKREYSFSVSLSLLASSFSLFLSFFSKQSVLLFVD